MSTTHHIPHVSLHLKRRNTHDVIRIAQAVYDGMSAHTDLFPTPNPTMATLLAETQALIVAQAAMASRAITASAVRDAARTTLCLSLDNELRYVQTLVSLQPDQADTLAHSAGMAVTGVRPHAKPVLDVKITPASGTVHLNANAHVLVGKSLKSHLFNWQWSQDGGITWHDVEATATAKATVSGLPALTPVHFRVRSVVGGIPGEWSQSVRLIVH